MPRAWTFLTVWFLWLAPWFAGAQTPKPPPDAWLTNLAAYPPGLAASWVRSNGFESLHAEVIVGRLKIVWSPDRPSSNTPATAYLSFEAPGHWPARDWRPAPMALRGQAWETTVAVTDIDLPMVYFVSIKEGAAPTLSPMRVCLPREVGLEEPTRIFWPFLEGFEEGLESWQLLTPGAPSLRTDPAAHTGKAALRVAVPDGKGSVTVATTRLRGWHVWKQNATGIRLWLRARQGQGRARFTLLANAFASNQVASIFPKLTPLADHWQKVDLAFSDFPELPLPSLDLLAIELIGPGSQEFLVDDLQLLGPWRTDLE